MAFPLATLIHSEFALNSVLARGRSRLLLRRNKISLAKTASRGKDVGEITKTGNRLAQGVMFNAIFNIK